MGRSLELTAQLALHLWAPSSVRDPASKETGEQLMATPRISSLHIHIHACAKHKHTQHSNSEYRQCKLKCWWQDAKPTHTVVWSVYFLRLLPVRVMSAWELDVYCSVLWPLAPGRYAAYQYVFFQTAMRRNATSRASYEFFLVYCRLIRHCLVWQIWKPVTLQRKKPFSAWVNWLH